MKEQTRTTDKVTTGIQPVKANITHTAKDFSYKVTYTERISLKEVRCGCSRLICKASAGSVIEHKCKCGKTETYKVAA